METALEMIIAVGDRDDEFRILIDKAKLQMRLGNFSAALELAEHAADIDISQGVGESLIEKANALTALGDFFAAIIAAEEAIRILEKMSAGELWRAHFACSDGKSNSEKNSDTKSFAKIETHLRLAIELLEKMRGQFADADESRRKHFSLANNSPAKTLHDFFLSQNRTEEAGEITHIWFSEQK